ncbi:MAG: DUF2062 domain-containing protein [Geminicoccaceae bacterium]
MFGRRKELPLWARLKGWLWPAMGWRRLGTYLLMRLTRLSGTSHSIAVGFACGAAISFTPLVGLHIVLSILLAFMLRGHAIAAAVGTVVGNPWTFPFIWLATYKVGQMVLGSAEAAPWPAVTMFKHVMVELGNLVWPTLTGQGSWEAVRAVLVDLRALIWPMAIGSIPLALIAGVATYFPVMRAIEAFQDVRQRRRERRREKRADAAKLKRVDSPKMTPAARSESCAS